MLIDIAIVVAFGGVLLALLLRGAADERPRRWSCIGGASVTFRRHRVASRTLGGARRAAPSDAQQSSRPAIGATRDRSRAV
jgi:hypothetical protein